MSSHPLEPLSAAEVERAVALLRTLPEFTPSTRVISVMLKEPPKELVHAWPDIEAPDREAEAVLHDNARNACFHVNVNLATGAVTPPRYAPPGSQPTMTIDEQVECEQAVLASPEFKAALKKHYGIDDTEPGDGRYLERRQLRRRGRPHAPPGPAALLPAHRPDRQRLRPADRRAAAGRRSQHDEGDPRRGVRPLAAAAAASATTPPTACRTSAPTSSRSRSRSRRGRASRSTATR